MVPVSSPIRIIQRNNFCCFASCAAMATGTTLDDVFNFIGHDGNGKGHSWSEIARYLLSKDILLGLIPSVIEKIPEIPDRFDIRVNFMSPAIFVVKSFHPEDWDTHAIYWAGGKVYDPAPESKTDMKLSDYTELTPYFLTQISTKPIEEKCHP